MCLCGEVISSPLFQLLRDSRLRALKVYITARKLLTLCFTAGGSVRSKWWSQEPSFPCTFSYRACFPLLNLLNSSSLGSLKIVFFIMIQILKWYYFVYNCNEKKSTQGTVCEYKSPPLFYSLGAYYSYVSLTHPHRQQLIA